MKTKLKIPFQVRYSKELEFQNSEYSGYENFSSLDFTVQAVGDDGA
jgi:hypothetical protein